MAGSKCSGFHGDLVDNALALDGAEMPLEAVATVNSNPGPSDPDEQLRRQYLYRLRAEQEYDFLEVNWHINMWITWKIREGREFIPGMEEFPGRLYPRRIWECFNKSFPIFVLEYPEGRGRHVGDKVMSKVCRLLINKWFQPYKSVIQWGRFLAKPMFYAVAESSTLENTGEIVERVRTLSQALSYAMQTALKESFDESHLRQKLVIQRLFRSVAVVLWDSDFAPWVTKTADIRALVVTTGFNNGLSAPIDIPGSESYCDGDASALTTTFGEAIDLLISLEKREETAFGI